MSNNIKIYTLLGISYDKTAQYPLSDRKIDTIIGYYTNIKNIYKNFDSKTIQSYSTVCSHINTTGIYRILKTRYLCNRQYKYFDEIIIKQVNANRLYALTKHVNTKRLIDNELSIVDFYLKENTLDDILGILDFD